MAIGGKDFHRDFVVSEHVVGQIGYGFIGKAVEALFQDAFVVRVYDKFIDTGHTLDDLTRKCSVIFVSVPTPMDLSTGECHTGIVESVLQDVLTSAATVGRSTRDFIVVLKSTVPPGFTDSMKARFPALRIVFSPEFLTEANAIQDFKTTNRILLGGAKDDTDVVYEFFAAVWPGRVAEQFDEPGKVTIVNCEPRVAEMAKLYTNALLAVKVTFANELYELCEKMGIVYDDVRAAACLDKRLGTHLKVPGPDGRRGFSGHCFPKDLSNLVFLCKSNSVPERLLSAAFDRNVELRPDRDWEKLEGRAVIGKKDA